MPKPIISVVMTAYNTEDFIAASIESILNQTMPNFELIIVDDGSTDGTVAVINTYLERDKRVVLIQNKSNLGQPKSLNTGISSACGKYIARMDSDDISLPQRFERQLEFMESNPEVILSGTGRHDLVNGEIQPSSYMVTDPDSALIAFSLVFGNFFMTHTSYIFRRELCTVHGIWYGPEHISSDFGLLLRVVGQFRVAVLPEALVMYRMHINSYSMANMEEGRKVTEQLQLNYIAGLGLTEESTKQLSFFIKILTQRGQLYLTGLDKAIYELADKFGIVLEHNINARTFIKRIVKLAILNAVGSSGGISLLWAYLKSDFCPNTWLFTKKGRRFARKCIL